MHSGPEGRLAYLPRQLYAYIRLGLLNGFAQLDFRRELSVDIT